MNPNFNANSNPGIGGISLGGGLGGMSLMALDDYGGDDIPLMPVMGEGPRLSAYIIGQQNRALGGPQPNEAELLPNSLDTTPLTTVPSGSRTTPQSVRLPTSLGLGAFGTPQGLESSLLPSALPLAPQDSHGNFQRNIAHRASHNNVPPDVRGLSTGNAFSSTFPIRNFGGMVAENRNNTPAPSPQQPLLREGSFREHGEEAPLRLGGVFAGTSRNAQRLDMMQRMTPPQMLITDPALLRQVQQAQNPPQLTRENIFAHEAASQNINNSTLPLDSGFLNGLTHPGSQDQLRQNLHRQSLAFNNNPSLVMNREGAPYLGVGDLPIASLQTRPNTTRSINSPKPRLSYYGGENDSDSVNDSGLDSRLRGGLGGQRNEYGSEIPQHPHTKYRHSARDALNDNTSRQYKTQQQQHLDLKIKNQSAKPPLGPTSAETHTTSNNDTIIHHPHDQFRDKMGQKSDGKGVPSHPHSEIANEQSRSNHGSVRDTEEDFDAKWSYLSTAIADIFNKRPVASSYQQLHGRVFSIVVLRQGKKLYKRTVEQLEHHIKEVADRINNCPEAEFRQVFATEFENFSNAVNRISDTMLYLNKNYCPQHQKPVIKEVARELFHDKVFVGLEQAFETSTHSEQAASENSLSSPNPAVYRYTSPTSVRIGNMVNAALEADRAGVVASSNPAEIKIISEVVYGINPLAFRCVVGTRALRAAATYYANQGRQVAGGTSTLRYVQLFFDMLDAERKRVVLYTNESLVEDMLEIIKTNFFTPQADRILSTHSLGRWLNELLSGSDYTADLQKVLLAYSMCGETRPLIDNIQGGIVALGSEIALGQTAATAAIERSPVSQQEKDNLGGAGEVRDAKGNVMSSLPKVTASLPIVEALMAFTDTFTATINATFTSKASNRTYEHEALMQALSRVVNTNPRMAEYLAYAVDSRIRTRCSEFHLTQFSEGVLRLYALLEDKDVFDQSYQYLFSQRLLRRYGSGGPPPTPVTQSAASPKPAKAVVQLTHALADTTDETDVRDTTTGSNTAATSISFNSDVQFQVLEHLFLKQFKIANGHGFGSKLDAMLNDCKQSEVLNVEFEQLMAIVPHKVRSPIDVFVSSSSDDDHPHGEKKNRPEEHPLDLTTITPEKAKKVTNAQCINRSDYYSLGVRKYTNTYDLGPSVESLPLFLQKGSIPHHMHVTVLTKGHWPLVHDLNVKLPPCAIASALMFKSFYACKYRSRILDFCLSQGSFDVRMKYYAKNQTPEGNAPTGEGSAAIQSRIVTLNVPTFATPPLLLFTATDVLTVGEIAQRTGLTVQEAARAVAAFLRNTTVCTSLLRVVSEGDSANTSPTPNVKSTSATLTAETKVEFNDNFRTSVKFVKVGTALLKEKNETAVKEATATAHRERSLEISAQIVKVMKSRQTHDHFGLVSDVQSGLKHIFPASADDIKKGIESLIDKEFIKRHPTLHGHYTYIS